MKNLKEDIKKKSFKPVYLLYGDERFLLEYYSKALLDAAVSKDNRLMNHDIFDGKNVPARQVIDAANTFPMFEEHRLVTVRDSGWFNLKRKEASEAAVKPKRGAEYKNDSEIMADYLPEIPETTVVLFVEEVIDKRGRLYKQIEKVGRAVACVKPSLPELNKWVRKVFESKGKKISPETAAVLMKTVSQGMTALSVEADKLAAYVGDRETVTAGDIAAVASPTLESRVFKLVDAAASGDKREALRLYGDMILLKESPFMILSMVTRQFRLILQCKAAQEKNMRRYEIAQALGIRDFVADECVSQGQKFSVPQLVAALKSCRDMDARIKSGMMDAETGVEMLVLKGLNS